QRTRRLELLPEPQRTDPAVLVVHGRDATRRRKLEAPPHGLDVLVVTDGEMALLEPPRRLLAEDPGRLTAGVALDDPALDLEVAACERKSGRVEPERVVVLREQRRGRLAGHLVQPCARRLLHPLAAAPAETADHAPVATLRAPDAIERVVDRCGAVE